MNSHVHNIYYVLLTVIVLELAMYPGPPDGRTSADPE